MNYLYWDLGNIGPENVIEVTLDKQANVILLNTINYSNYKHGRKYTYYGGLAKVSPIRLSPKNFDHWYVVVDLGGYSGKVRASVNVY